MPRPATDRIDRSELPEFLRSKAIGAVIAEALDAAASESASPGALGDMVSGAAREIREFHDLPASDQRTDPHRFGIVSYDEHHDDERSIAEGP